MENIVSVSVLVFKDEEILFVKSNAESSGLKLVLPGGKLGDSENIEECAVREVMESAGIDIKLEKKLSGVITRRNKKGNLLITFVYLAEAVSPLKSSNAVYIPLKVVKHYNVISDFSKLIVEKLIDSNLSAMDRQMIKGLDGREYLMYF